MPKNLTTYAATKAGVAHLAEGLRAELHGGPIKVTVLYPGYIASEMNDRNPNPSPMLASTEKGVRAMVVGHREGEGLRVRARPAVGAARHGDAARADAALQEADLRRLTDR